jgi:hypothetical protein
MTKIFGHVICSFGGRLISIVTLMRFYSNNQSENGGAEMKNKTLVVSMLIFLLLSLGGVGNALTINLDAKTSPITPVEVYLSAGTYIVTPIIDEYTAWTAWSDEHAWLNEYWLDSNEFEAFRVNNLINYGTVEEAFSNALGTTFTLAANGSVSFFIVDHYPNDNSGGMSLSLSPAPVPEPSTIMLMSLGLVGLVGFGRKKLKK